MSKVDDWIQTYSEGGSFVDIGGLFRTYGEKVTFARKSGASTVSMVDVQPEGHKLWTAFKEHAEQNGAGDCQCIVANATKPDFLEKVGEYDMVHCSGLIYHVPDPVSLLLNLKAVANRYLILKSVVVPEIIKGKSDQLKLDTGALFIPAVDDAQRQILWEYFESIKIKVHGINGQPIPSWLGKNGMPRTGPWWWLWTPAYMKHLLKAVELDVIDEAPVNAPRSYAFLCRIQDK